MRSAATRVSEPPYREWVAAWGGMALLGGLGITRRLRRRNEDGVESE